MKQATGYKIRRWAGKTLVILTLAMIGLWLVWPHERLLTTIARPVPGANLGKASVWNEDLCWVSSHQLLIVTTVQLGRFGNGNSTNQNWQGYADLLDTDTGARTRLTNLTNLLTRTTALPMIGMDEFKTSPDGQWLLWDTYAHRTELGRPHVAHLDGSSYREWEEERYEENFFLDSLHLAQIQVRPSGPFLVVRDLLAPHRDGTYTTWEQAKAVLAPYIKAQPVFVRVLDPATETNPGYITIATYRKEDDLHRELSSDNYIGKMLKPIQTRKVKSPGGAGFTVGEVSPNRKWIYYYLVTARTNLLLTWLHRIFPKFTPKPMLTEELWSSRVDGQGMKEIGHVPLQTDATDQPESGLSNMDWLPDDKHISFVYRNTLYIVPAEP
jgi:hypothetical protein